MSTTINSRTEAAAPAPTFGTAMPTTVPGGAPSTAVAISGTGFYNPPLTGMSSCRRGIAASTSHSGLGFNALTFTNAGSLTLDVDTSTTAPGTATIVITNPDGQEISFPLTVGSNSNLIFNDDFETGDPNLWSNYP